MLAGLALPAWSQTTAPGKWTADWDVLNRHKVPDWILDAKIGVQYVGEPMDLNDFNGWLWGRSAWRHRENGAPPPTAHELLWKDKFTFRGGFPRVFEHNPIKDTDAVLARYKDLGARFVVSMREAAYPGTEGLWMDQREIASARKLGMKVGVHYNLIRRDGVPSIGDAGYVDWTQTRMRKAVEEADADFVFFDGCQFAPSGYFKTDEFVAWYYNWADRKGKQVWVNDDLGNDRQETGEYGDLVDYESCTVEGISPKPWINWDILRNDWACWINEFGVHRLNGKKWVWEYKPPAQLIRVFLDVVSKGGVWLVQMDNTGQSWKNMEEIGAWLKVNGEAIYGTRPYGKVAEHVVRIPAVEDKPKNGQAWWWQFQEVMKTTEKNGPLYYTRKGNDLYAIHYGWPGASVKIEGVQPKPGSKIRMLGVDEDLPWRQEGSAIVVQSPSRQPCKYAYSYRIPLK